MTKNNIRLKLEEAPGQTSKIKPVNGDGNDQPENEYGSTSLLSLNDDCFHVIFKKLSLDDLSKLSQTCERIHRLGGNYFQRHYKEKVLTIDGVSENGAPNYGPRGERYVVAFTKYIRNVTLDEMCAANLSTLRRLTAYYGKDDVASIKHLHLESWTLRQSHGRLLGKLVKDVESVTFSDITVYGDLYECVLKYMENMKEMILLKTFLEPGDGSTTWMQQKYLKLERFAWHVNNQSRFRQEPPMTKIKQFFTINPTIQIFSLFAKSLTTVNQLITENVRVDELFFDTQFSNLLESFDILLALCETQSCRLHLKFSWGFRKFIDFSFEKLVKLAPYVEGLYFEGAIDAKIINILVTFNRLKVLQCVAIEDANHLIDIPNLEEIYLDRYYISGSRRAGCQSAFMKYAGRSAKLKKIYLKNINNLRLLPGNPLQDMVNERLKLNGAPKLEIFILSNDLSCMARLIDTRNCYNKIDVVCAETEVVKNPFVINFGM